MNNEKGERMKATKLELERQIQAALAEAPSELECTRQEQPHVTIRANGTEYSVYRTKEVLEDLLRRVKRLEVWTAPKMPHIPKAAIDSSTEVLRKQEEYKSEGRVNYGFVVDRNR